MPHRRKFVSVNSVLFVQKKSNMKHQSNKLHTSFDHILEEADDDYDNEISQTPEYLLALSQFLERRSPISKNNDADIDTVDNEKLDTSSSKQEKSSKLNTSETKNTSSSVNYEKFQSGKINDSLQKNLLQFTTSPELSSDVNARSKTVTLKAPETVTKTRRNIVSKKIKNEALTKQDRNKINDLIKNDQAYSTAPPIDKDDKIEDLSSPRIINLADLQWSMSRDPKQFGWYCEWRQCTWNSMKICVRRVKSHCVDNTCKFLIPEINALSKLRHRNILILMGYTMDTSNSIIPVYENYRYSLNTYIHEMAAAMSMSQICHLFTQIAEAVYYSNQLGIIHTTISSHCIMFSDETNLPKLCAFEFSVKKNHSVTKDIGRTQWYQWLAPEFFQARALIATPLIDIYSLCAVIWECCYLSVPWDNVSKTHLTQIYTEWKMGLSISTEMLPVVFDLLKLGLAIQPNKRTLSISQIISTLNDLKKRYSNEEEGAFHASRNREISPERLETQPQKVIVKKLSISEPDGPDSKQYVTNSSTTVSPKSLSSDHSPKRKLVSKLPKLLPRLKPRDSLGTKEAPLISAPEILFTPRRRKPIKIETTTSDSSNSKVKQIVANYESTIQSSRESIDYENIDHTNCYIRNTDIKPASHRTGMVKVPAIGLHQSLSGTNNTSSFSYTSSFSTTSSSQPHVSIFELKNYFETHLWSREQQKCLSKMNGPEKSCLQEILQTETKQRNQNLFDSVSEIVEDIVDSVTAEAKVFKTELKIDVGKPEDKKITISNAEFEQINVEMFKLFFKFYKQFISANFTTSGTPITVQEQTTSASQLLKIELPKLCDPNKIPLLREPMFNYWNLMLRFYLKALLDDLYIDDDFTAETLQLLVP